MENLNIVKIERSTIDEKTIHVSNDHTIYIDVSIPDAVLRYSPEQLLLNYRNAITKAKENGANIKYKHKTLSRIKELNKALPDAIAEYTNRFNKLKAGWEAKLKSGLTIPTVDDVEYQALLKQATPIIYAYNRNAPIGQLLDIHQTLERISDTLYSTNTDTTIYI